MTDQEIKIAVAEVMDWRHEGRLLVNGWIERNKDCGDIVHYGSNVTNDLNAMHEAERVLTGEQWDKYTDFLCALTDPDWDGYRSTAHATARQRAEAFLRTIGKWKD